MSTDRFNDPGVRCNLADCGEEAGSGNDHVLTGVGTISNLGFASLPYPSLQFHGYQKFVYTGTCNFTAAGAGNEAKVGFRLLDNGSGVSGVPSPVMLLTGGTGGAGRFIFECELFVNGNHDGVNDITMRQVLTIVNADETENSVTRYYQNITTLDQKLDHNLGFSVTVAVNGTATWSDFSVKSSNGHHFGQRSVS